MTDRESAAHKQMEAPERIWLQDDGDWQLYDHGDEHVTWCQDKVNDNDTEYVRADLLAEAVEALRKMKRNAATQWVPSSVVHAIADAALATINGDKTNG